MNKAKVVKDATVAGVNVGNRINHGAQVTATVISGSAGAVLGFVIGLVAGVKGAKVEAAPKPVAKKVVRRTK